jgi:hypothetical protein
VLRRRGGEGGAPVAWGAAPSSGEAPGPAHEDGKWVRWLGTDGVAEIEVRRGGGGLPVADNRRWSGRNATGGRGDGGALYTCAHGERG